MYHATQPQLRQQLVPYMDTVQPENLLGIKLGSLVVLGETTKLKSAKIFTACMYGDTVPDRQI